MVGRSLTAVTVSRKLDVAVAVPSLTVRVMVDVPFWFAAGVTVTVRVAPLPLKTRLALGTNVVFDELPVTVRLATAVSASPTVKASAPVFVSSLIVWAASAEIVGDVLADAFTVRMKVEPVAAVPSLTVTVIVAVPV